MRLSFVRFIWLITLLAVPTLVEAQVYEADVNPPRIDSAKKITVGVVEDVVLNPWGVSFPARIDTGADLSSLDARDIVVRNDVAVFKLGKRYGGVQIQLPVVEWRRIQTATGTEKRPVVEISICLGSKLFRTPVTLKDRSEMMYPFLVGRSALSGSFLVDPSRSKALQPACPAASLASSQAPSQTKE
ncbi:MAG TPA: RimK/LysX family protein [Candidatus Binatia bacterium]|jgi:hypothetical protein